MNNSHHNIALFGTFDIDNFGDCLFPLIVEHHLKKRLGKIQLYPFSPTSRVARIANYSRVYSFNELSLTFSEPPSCIMVGGGDLISTADSPSIYPQLRNILYPYSIKTWLLPIMAADAWNCPSMLNAVGMSPLFDKDFNELTRMYLQKLDLCLVRDRFSAERLSEIQVDSEIVPDSAFSVPNLLNSSEWAMQYQQIAKQLKLPSKFMVAQVAFYLEENHIKVANAIAQSAISSGLPVVLLPICHHHSDIQSLRVVRKILRKNKIEVYMVDCILNTLQTSSVLANASLYIGTSLHGAIITLAFGNPAVSYSSRKKGKHYGVLSELGLEICHTNQADDIPDIVSNLLRLPKKWYATKIESANIRINDYFDRMAKIIMTARNSAIPKDWSQKASTGKISCKSMHDFENLTKLCLSKKHETKTWKRWMQYLLRTNLTTSEYYDRLIFWLRKHKILS